MNNQTTIEESAEQFRRESRKALYSKLTKVGKTGEVSNRVENRILGYTLLTMIIYSLGILGICYLLFPSPATILSVFISLPVCGFIWGEGCCILDNFKTGNGIWPDDLNPIIFHPISHLKRESLIDLQIDFYSNLIPEYFANTEIGQIIATGTGDDKFKKQLLIHFYCQENLQNLLKEVSRSITEVRTQKNAVLNCVDPKDPVAVEIISLLNDKIISLTEKEKEISNLYTKQEDNFRELTKEYKNLESIAVVAKSFSVLQSANELEERIEKKLEEIKIITCGTTAQYELMRSSIKQLDAISCSIPV